MLGVCVCVSVCISVGTRPNYRSKECGGGTRAEHPSTVRSAVTIFDLQMSKNPVKIFNHPRKRCRFLGCLLFDGWLAGVVDNDVLFVLKSAENR